MTKNKYLDDKPTRKIVKATRLGMFRTATRVQLDPRLNLTGMRWGATRGSINRDSPQSHRLVGCSAAVNNQGAVHSLVVQEYLQADAREYNFARLLTEAKSVYDFKTLSLHTTCPGTKVSAGSVGLDICEPDLSTTANTTIVLPTDFPMGQFSDWETTVCIAGATIFFDRDDGVSWV